MGAVVAVAVAAAGPPSEFTQRLDPIDFAGNNYLVSGGRRGGYTDMLDDLQRGHEGLIVKLNDVIRALKEDEVKLNNVFYKLGSHDTNIQGVDNNVHRLADDSRRIEAKLNKHAFNVDFLRRQVERLQGSMEAEERVESEVSAVRSIVNRLDDRLTDALARLGMVENTTRTLEKRSAPHYYTGGLDDLMVPAIRPPTLTVYPLPRQADTCKPKFEQVGQGCYWFGGEELTYTEAVAACLGHGSTLLTLPSPGTQLDLLLARLRPDTHYWTSGTDAFHRGDWAFLLTAQPVMPLHWASGENNTSPAPHRHCAALSTHGLTKLHCTHRLPYICHTI
ncbi:hypothetical protein Pmani_024381 [Petrolisthes manimaculis]|uniref:C-type lectin domain-containing protein n=1 Tax=Petrolisthes manimaculis TaxID=1843537 RepID=A0AAE1PAG3_9EUCA|nr:hypothetical protein Pmani_024381 [Petrolisthes manimaculis]